LSENDKPERREELIAKSGIIFGGNYGALTKNEFQEWLISQGASIET